MRSNFRSRGAEGFGERMDVENSLLLLSSSGLCLAFCSPKTVAHQGSPVHGILQYFFWKIP